MNLDADYFKKKLLIIARDINDFTPGEMFNELSRLMMVAATQAGYDATLKIKPSKVANSKLSGGESEA